MAKCNWLNEGDVRDAYINGIQNAEAAFDDGIDNPRRNPIEAAVAAINAGIWKKNFQNGVDKWANALRNVSLDQWKKAALAAAATYADRASTVGVDHWGSYYTKAESTIKAASQELVNSKQDRDAWIQFFKKMGALKEI